MDNIREQYTDSFLKNAAGKVRKSKECRYSKGESLTIYKAHKKGALSRDTIKVPALAGGAGYAEKVLYYKDCDLVCDNADKRQHDDCSVVIHPTQKPLALAEKWIRGSLPQNILIPFAGSGSECVVAKKHGINFYATDINSDYVKLANNWLGISQ